MSEETSKDKEEQEAFPSKAGQQQQESQPFLTDDVIKPNSLTRGLNNLADMQPASHEKVAEEQFGNPIEMIESWVEERNGNGLIALGEHNHHGTGTLEFEITLIKQLQEKFGLKKVFLEEDVRYMPLVQQFYETGQMPSELRRYLTSGFVREDTEHGHDYKLRLVEMCQKMGIPVKFVNDSRLDTGAYSFQRDIEMANLMYEDIGDILRGLNLFIVGRSHVLHDGLIAANSGKREPTAISVLEQIYPRSDVFAIHAMTIFDDDAYSLDKEDAFYKSIAADLKKKRRMATSSGMWLAGSNYGERVINQGNQTKLGGNVDMIITNPGVDLAKKEVF